MALVMVCTVPTYRQLAETPDRKTRLPARWVSGLTTASRLMQKKPA
jgi:hypothetical protein